MDKTAMLQTAGKQVGAPFNEPGRLYRLIFLDLGCDQRWHDLFSSLVTVILHDSFICGLKEVQILLLV